VRRFRSLCALIVGLSLGGAVGCSIFPTPAQTVGSHQIARNFYRARYIETCPIPANVQPWCSGFNVGLDRYEGDLNEADAALQIAKGTGGKLPLQLHELKLDRKALAKKYQRTRPVPVPRPPS
jgi:hypothetical protein